MMSPAKAEADAAIAETDFEKITNRIGVCIGNGVSEAAASAGLVLCRGLSVSLPRASSEHFSVDGCFGVTGHSLGHHLEEVFTGEVGQAEHLFVGHPELFADLGHGLTLVQ